MEHIPHENLLPCFPMTASKKLKQHVKSCWNRSNNGERRTISGLWRKNDDCKRRVICYNACAMSSMMIQVTEETKEQIERLARTTGKPKETILGEVVETGLKNYHTTPTPTKGVQALLDLA